jgi:uracil-DNA glycosylase family 4
MFVQATPSPYESEVASALIEPGVGAAFVKTLAWLGLSRSEVYVTSLLKCATTSPTRSEWEACQAHFSREVALISPRVIVALGPLTAQILLNLKAPIVGEWGELMGIPVMPTFHFSEMVRAQENLKREFASHLRRAQHRLAQLPPT